VSFRLFVVFFLTANIISFSFASSEDSLFRKITNPEEVKSIMSSFQQNIVRIGSNAKIIKCDNIIRYIPLRKSGRDTSYGAHCNVDIQGKVSTFFMCDDEMIGKFTLQSSGTLSEDWIHNLIKTNCPPGD
jgi:MFS-type transporter involved in bile tolerance (Atg22 family)